MINIAIFASGNGTNAVNIYNYFKNKQDVCIKCVVCDNPKAGIIDKCKQIGCQCFLIERKLFKHQSALLPILDNQSIDFIVLAGFLAKVPDYLVEKYEGKMVNIHPSLLPKYGGKGMYGNFVHQAVIDNKDKFSGITIHFVNNKYDDGEIIFQAQCPVLENDTPHSLAMRIHQLEYEHFPKVIESTLLKCFN